LSPKILVPKDVYQHKTAGPYSPVLQVCPGQIVVISGQAAIDMDGNIIGNTIEEQAEFTIENCRDKLKQAGCTLNGVFKVNVFLSDISLWDRFNRVYTQYFSQPYPVRTAVGAQLLPGIIVEIEMWAIKE